MVAKLLTASAAIAITLFTASKDDFTPLEQRQVCVATPEMFSGDAPLSIDFAAMRLGGFRFPADDGEATLIGDTAISVAARSESSVMAMFDGTVRLSRYCPATGNTVVVRHDNGLETVYERLGQRLVRVGQKVLAGEAVGTMGSGGRCSVGIMANGWRLNPSRLIDIDDQRLLRQTVELACANGGVSLDVTVPDLVELARIAEAKREAEKKAFRTPFAEGNTFAVDLASLAPDDWCYPLPDSKVISNYGRRGGRNHSGVDIKTKPNDTIRAAFDGIVTMSKRFSAYGNCVIVRHPNGLETLYGHNSRNLVNCGDSVRAGQAVALTGRTGRATTEHLHFECRIGGVPFDPSKVFDHNSEAIRLQQLTFTKTRAGSISITSDSKLMAKK